MTSKLLHAIVGVGIAIGAGAGCGGSSVSSEVEPKGPDTSKFDPFCDASWPTTKGSPGPPACVDPMNQCDPSTRVVCYAPLEPKRCDYERSSAFCIDGTWQCHPELVDAVNCKCFGDGPPGYVCTDTGWMPAPGGAG